MMLALAQFIMRGRLQAAIPALFAMTIPLLPLGAIGLVTLRKGPNEGAIMVLIALVPAILSGFMGAQPPSALVFWGTLLGILAVYVPALCLRATVSWSFTIQVAVAASVIMALVAASLIPVLMEGFVELTARFLAVLEGRSPTDGLIEPSQAAVSGFVGLVLLSNGVTGLVLARWWQSSLYNPGGFGDEFHQLRLGVLPSSLCLIFVGLCHFQGIDYSFWATIFALPLIMVSIAIAHSFAKSQKLTRTWLVVFYMLMIVFSPVLLVLAIIGFADSWINIRSRFSSID